MATQVPKSIKSIHKEVQDYVLSNIPNVMMFEQVSPSLQVKWAKKCEEHELFHQDINRFIGDVYSLAMSKVGF